MSADAPAQPHVFRIATRGSALARAQTDIAVNALRGAAQVDTEVVVIRSSGDRSPDVPAELMEGQGWFTAELEAALLDGRADAAVHSAKDLPTELAPGLVIVAYLPRGDARDALVTPLPGTPAGFGEGATAGTSGSSSALDTLPEGAAVGTSSPRRAAFLRGLRPDLRAVSMRGNVDTRLRKLDEGEVDALLLAAAGLDRLGLGGRATQRLDPRHFVPAPAQGVIAVEARPATPAAQAGATADDADARAAVQAEREVLRRLGGGCRLALGAWARREGDRLVLVAALATDEADPTRLRTVELAGDPSDPQALGAAAAERLRQP